MMRSLLVLGEDDDGRGKQKRRQCDSKTSFAYQELSPVYRHDEDSLLPKLAERGILFFAPRQTLPCPRFMVSE
jgi:hypothetical protein